MSQLLISAFCWLCIAGPAAALEINGFPKVIDGDTVIVDDKPVRFAGIDAPEVDQFCEDERGQTWNCGIDARDALVKRFGRDLWHCRYSDLDAEGRILATCTAANEDIGRWLVRQGWAISFRRYGHLYDGDEDLARQQHIGLWSGAFIAPWEWSTRTCSTKVLNEIALPLDVVGKLCHPSPNPIVKGCTIKASQKRSNCIYHMVGDRDYRITGGGANGPRWFCSIEAAEAAGCRHAKQ